MIYSVGDRLRVDGDEYRIIGTVQYRNPKDNTTWFEYRMIATQYNQERWLSIDDTYREYSISKAASNISTAGYHLVDEGMEEVIGAWGDVDVTVGDKAYFKEFEDITEEKIISLETWDDGEEQSTGYYLDAHEIQTYSGSRGGVSTNQSRGSYRAVAAGGNGKSLGIIACVGMILVCFFGTISSSLGKTTIAKYLEKSANYIYVTSITGNQKEKADVYKSKDTLENTVYDIVNAIDGDTEHVQQNTEDGDNSIAILTDKEYCLVYTSEDNDVLVQISTRKYAYYTDSTPYRANRHTHRYYRRYYYSRGYTTDSGSYGGDYTSPYSSYDDTTINTSYSDTYNTYSNSVRQASISARQSSGGGISSGK